MRLALGIGLVLVALASCDDSPLSGTADSDTDAIDALEADTALDPADALPVAHVCGNTRLAPLPVALDDHIIVPIDVTSLASSMTFDPANKVASVTSQLTFDVGPNAGWPVFDLRQTVLSGELDGHALSLSDLSRQTLSPTDPQGMMILRQDLPACSEHVLTLVYELITPASDRYNPSHIPMWTDAGVIWESDFSDMDPGEYLERWFPAPLPHDDFAFTLAIDVLGDSAHTVLANATVTQSSQNHWSITFPSDTDSTLPLVYLAPATALTIASSDATLVFAVSKFFGPYDEATLASMLVTATDALAEFTARFGPRPDTGPFLLIMGAPVNGMEYRNAALVGPPLIEFVRHEILHAWFARSVRPARAVDAWLDEAIVSRIIDYPDTLRIEDFQPTIPLLGAGDPWTRNTLNGAHYIGAKLMASLEAHFGLAATDQVLNDLVRDCADHHITHHDLRRAFAELGDVTYVNDLWTTYVLADWDREYLSGDCPRWQ